MKIWLNLIGGMLLFWGGTARLEAQATEVSTTAPVGGWLWEVDVLRAAVDNRTSANEGIHRRSISLGSVMVSTGLNARWDVQFGFEPWRQEQETGGGLSLRDSGRGDGWLRAKWNFSGDENNGPAWALLPYLKLPLGEDPIGNNEFEPGLLLLFARPIDDATRWHANLGLDLLADGFGGRDSAMSGSTSITRSCRERLSAYAEFVGWVARQDASNWSAEIGGGINYILNDRGWLDLALYVGLSKAAPDYTPVLRAGWQF